MKTLALKIINNQYQNFTTIFTDGSKITNPKCPNLNLKKPTKSRENFLNQTILILKTLNSNKLIVECLWIPSHIDIKGKELADQLAKIKLNEPNCMLLKYSKTELNSLITTMINQKWQSE